MKKLLNILGAIGIVASSAASVVACGGKGSGGNSVDEFIDNEIMGNNAFSNEEKNMYSATSFMTKMMILSRHENLNYYLNDIIQGTYSNDSMLVSQAAGAPSTITVKDSKGNEKVIDINKTYIDPLNEKYTPLNQYIHKHKSNGDSGSESIDLQSWMYAGMVDDKSYNDYISKTINGGDDTYDYYDKTTYGNQGLERSALLNDNLSYLDANNSNPNYRQDRLNLKWMQTGGPLSDYIFANDSLWNESNPRNGKRNTYPRATSQKILNNATEGNAPGGKTTIVPSDDGVHYDIKAANGTDNMKMGSLYQTLRNAEFNGKITNQLADIFPVLKQITNSEDGASIATSFLHSIFPVSKVSTLDDEIAGTVIYAIIDKILSFFEQMIAKDGVVIGGITDNEMFKAALSTYKSGHYKYGLPSIASIASKSTFDFNKIANSDFFENISGVADALEASDIDQTAMWNSVLNDTIVYPFQELFSMMFNGSPEIMAKAEDPTYLASINMLGLIKQTINLIASFKESKQQYLDDYDTIYANNDLTVTKENVAKLFGWDKANNKWNSNSTMDKLFDVINNSDNEGNAALNTFILNPDSLINQSRQSGSNDIWNNLYQYILKDEYWDVENYQYNKHDNTANNSLGDTITYSMTYKGKGDSSVDYDLLTKKTESTPVTDGTDMNKVKGNQVLDDVEIRYMNGNDGGPYGLDKDGNEGAAVQMVRKNGGEMAGGLDNLIKMNGLGNAEDLRDVTHKYNVTWQNVSTDENTPYWVVTAINAFNDDNQEYFYYY